MESLMKLSRQYICLGVMKVWGAFSEIRHDRSILCIYLTIIIPWKTIKKDLIVYVCETQSFAHLLSQSKRVKKKNLTKGNLTNNIDTSPTQYIKNALVQFLYLNFNETDNIKEENMRWEQCATSKTRLCGIRGVYRFTPVPHFEPAITRLQWVREAY